SLKTFSGGSCSVNSQKRRFLHFILHCRGGTLTMVVTLRVVSYQKNVLGADAQVQFDPKGGSFGRSEDNDWVLPDPERIISSRHGIVDFRDGEFWITDCSTNGIYLGDRSVLLGKGKSVMLHHGDHLILGEYEVEVDVHSARLQSCEIPTGARTP